MSTLPVPSCNPSSLLFSAPSCLVGGRCHRLRLNQACLALEYLYQGPWTQESVVVLAQSLECEQCPLRDYARLARGEEDSMIVNTSFPAHVRLRNAASRKDICSFTYHFREFGIYSLNFTGEPDHCSEIATIQAPNNYLLPILWAFIFFVTLFLLRYLVFKHFLKSEIWRWLSTPRCPVLQDLGPPSESGRNRSENRLVESPPQLREARRISPSSAASSHPAPQRRSSLSSGRLASLDAFRGFAITLMIFVNYGGGGYWFFQHSTWNGLTIADLVFPWFLWIMGVCVPLSLHSRIRSRGESTAQLFLHCLRRSVLLFLFGLAVNSRFGKNDLSKLRIPGVLQRFSVAYLVVTVLELSVSRRPPIPEPYSSNAERPGALADVRPCLVSWFVVGCGVALHLVLTLALNVPGCGRGYLGPGGMHKGGLYANCTGGAAGWIDREIFGPAHLHRASKLATIYNTTLPYDPEGALGTLTTILLAYFGVQAGRTLLTYRDFKPRVKRFLIWCTVLGGCALWLCECRWNEGWIPINKNLWSLSFVLISGATSLLLFSILMFILDHKKWWRGGVFVSAGRNSILLYVGHEFLAKTFPVQFGPVPETHMAQLGMHLWGTSFWLLVALYCDKKKFYFVL